MTKQMKLNLANCYQKMLTVKKIQILLIMYSQKVVIVVSIFLSLTRGTVSVKWGGVGGGGGGRGLFNKFSTSERWI